MIRSRVGLYQSLSGVPLRLQTRWCSYIGDNAWRRCKALPKGVPEFRVLLDSSAQVLVLYLLLRVRQQ